jgi:endonuclease YncB( thermonuclease family)
MKAVMPGFVHQQKRVVPPAGFLALTVLALATPGLAGGKPTLPEIAACPTAGTETAKVTKVDDRLDLALADGRSLQLVGLDPPQATKEQPDLALRARDSLAARVGAGINFLPLSATPDRWGRIPAFVFFPGQDAPQAADYLLSQGFARYMPTPEAHACRSAFLGAEAKARTAQRGLWRDPYYAIIAATNRAAFADKAASNVIVEGPLAAVTSTGFRTTLDFAPRREHAFSVTILQRNVAIFERSGLDFHALIGRTLRVRGLLDLRFGPQIELSSTDAIELITNEQKQGSVDRRSESNATPPPTRNP